MVPECPLVASELVLPASDTGLEQVCLLLAGEGLIPDEWRAHPISARSANAPKRPGHQRVPPARTRRLCGVRVVPHEEDAGTISAASFSL